MNRISILDCTLRDGGYVNNFNFGEKEIKEIVSKLSKASIDIIECGFLRSGESDKNRTVFNGVESIKDVICEKNNNLLYVAMIQVGAISLDEISDYDCKSIDGIRVTFHEHEIEEAFALGKGLMEKGYRVFMQPVGTTTYTDEALLHLIEKINTLKPYAFYMVDTLGTMYKNDLLRMFYLVDHNLDKHITLGFHSHNNLQLSFSNAQELMQLNSPRKIIIDSSVYGMGRGAGNLNTELMTHYINKNFQFTYDNIEILELIDVYIKPLSRKYPWGYDAAYYIASVVECHPNYASYLLNKQTLHVQDIYAILNNLCDDRKSLFDIDYIADEYVKHMSCYVDDTETIDYVAEKINGKKVLILAPGKSLRGKTSVINEIINRENCFVTSVNFIPMDIRCDMAFISNMKRFKGIDDLLSNESIGMDVLVTSNIMAEPRRGIRIVNYRSYNNEDKIIVDNAGLMCINLLKKAGVQSIILAGFDGFEKEPMENFYHQSLFLNVEAERLQQLNMATSKKLKQLETQLEIKFAFDSKYSIDEDEKI